MMNFFTCLAPKKKKDEKEKSPFKGWDRDVSNKAFTFLQLAEATQIFHHDNFLGQGNFGRVYGGTIGDQSVAVKLLDLAGLEDNLHQFHLEVLWLSGLSHPNLVDLIGYCCDGNQKLLVYEYMCRGPLDRHLFRTVELVPEDVAMGLEYLHEMEEVPIIYQDLKCSNILLGEQYNAKLSDLGQGKFGVKENIPLIFPYQAYGLRSEKYLRSRELIATSDIYSQGVLMLELITGCETSQDGEDHVLRARPMLGDKQRYKELVDRCLVGKYPEKDLNKAVTVAIKCLQEDPESRPTFGEVVEALKHLANEQKNPGIPDKSKSKEPICEPVRAQAKDQASSSSRSPQKKMRDS